MHTLLKEIMTSTVDVISRETNAAEAALKMKYLNVGAIPVCDGERLCGMVTDRDLVVRIVAKGLDPKQVHVSDATSSEVFFCYEDEDLEKASQVMSQKQIRRLPILSRAEKLVGIVSLGDLAVRGKDAQTSGVVLEQVSRPS
ncbi:MAG TPA: CBS domain-containing protein [Nitrospiraceae bacterium]|jgi:CBS domain-containing protein|nr:CBS domain-containing protein [Nitrospiraceae bacterium]